MPTVQFYLDYRSPYSYLAQSQLSDVALDIQPFDVLDVMKRVNNTPTTITCAVKNRYATADLGRWAARYDLAAEEIDYPWLRRYAAQMAERGLAPRTVSRKLAGLRACFRVLV